MDTKFLNKLMVLLVFGVLIFFSSCKKFLDQQPITDVGPNVVFSDISHAQQALLGVYSRLVGDQGYGIRLSLYYPLDNDAMQGPTGSADNDRRDIARYSATSGNAQLLKPFNQLFQGIEYANICIENIPKMDLYSKGSDNEKKQLKRMYGEALTLRAQFYFEAIRNWGDLPAHFQPASVLAVNNPFPVRTSTDSLYDHLLADLKAAEDLVPWRNEISGIGDPNDQRITKGTVKGLRARIALFRGGYSLHQDGTMKRNTDYKTYYQIARDECNDIIASGQHALNPSYKSLWKDQVCGHAVNDPDGELMFQACGIGKSGAEDTKLGYYNGPRVNNKGNNSVNPLATYFYLFDSTDQRRDVTVCHYFTNSNGTRAAQVITGITDGKYRRDWISNPAISPSDAIQYFSLSWQILRYSDVLLMFAEAENEINNGPTAAAYNAINMVRRRGYGIPINTAAPNIDIPSGLSQADFFKYIVRERALEFGGEGIRKYDLIRWNLLSAAITETRANLINMSTNAALADPSYMAGYPVYCKVTSLPTSMYMINGTTSDDNNIGGLWSNSLYTTAPASTPSGTTKVTWVGTAINTISAARFATGFTTGKSELLPIPQGARDANYNLSQNFGY